MTRTDKPGPRMATERWFDVALQVSDARRDGPKPRLRWRHRGEINGVVMDDWLVQKSGDTRRPPLIAVYPGGYRLTETEIMEYTGR